MLPRCYSWTLPGVLVLALLATVGPDLSIVRGVDETPMTQHMNALNEHMKTLRRQARRLEFDETTLKAIQDMQVHAVSAMAEIPPKAKNLTGKERAQFLVGFKKQMAKLVNQLFEIEVALLEDKKEAAKEAVESLAALKTEGHEKFTDQ